MRIALILIGCLLVGMGIGLLLFPVPSTPSTGYDTREYELDYEPWKGATEIKMWVESTGISKRTYIIAVRLLGLVRDT